MGENIKLNRFFTFALMGMSVAWGTQAYANRIVVDELRNLRATLNSNDPTRKEIGLRLADELANEALTGSERATRGKADQAEALSLYNEMLAKEAGPMKVKIQFQIARLYSEYNNAAKADAIFTELSNQTTIPEIRLEALHRRAEYLEQGNQTAKAEGIYRTILGECQGTDLCSYVHYRLGWILKGNGKLADGIKEVRLGLFDSKNQIRDEALRDLISFMALDPANAQSYISELEALQEKTGQKTMLDDLGAGYLANGSLPAAAKVMELTNSRNPNMMQQVRLMEIYLGAKDWDNFERSLGKFTSMGATGLPANIDQKDSVEIEKIMKRMAIQLDGERKTDASKLSYFTGVTSTLLKLYPTAKDRLQTVEGLIAAQSADEAKVQIESEWLARTDLNNTEKQRLLELRVTTLQKMKKDAAVEGDLAQLAAIPGIKAEKVREYRYAMARTQYDLGKKAEALVTFKEIAALPASGMPDQLAIQSQNLALSILAEQKNWAELSQMSNAWINNKGISSSAALAKDIGEMKRMNQEAQFEAVAAMGETPDALKNFHQLCKDGQFLPKSCENAKYLSVKLNQHEALLDVLKITHQNEELMGEYEAGGYFSETAKMLESNKAKDFKTELKIALLYEAGLDDVNKNRVINQMLSTKRASPLSDEEQAILFSLVNRSRDVTADLMNKPVGSTFSMKVADALENQGQANDKIRATLMKSTTSTGPGWNKAVIAEAKKMEANAAKINFYGRGGEKMIQKRIASLKSLAEFVERYVGGADIDTRIQILDQAKKGYTKLSLAIANAPLPEGLSEADVQAIRTQIDATRKPFDERADAYQKLLAEQIAKVTAPETRAALEQWASRANNCVAMQPCDQIDTAAPATASATSTEAPKRTNVNAVAYQAAVAKLKQNPRDAVATQELVELFRTAGSTQVSQYLEARLKAAAPTTPTTEVKTQ